MEVYIGMDISLQRTNLCMVDASGKIVHEGSAASDAAELDRYLRTSRGKDVVIVSV
jgi:predicted NBD/HSP70 family sugar kinase